MNKDAYRELNKLSGKASAEERQEKPSRREKKTLMSWHDAAVVRQLKAIAFEHEKTQQALIQEALNLLFAKYGKDQIA
jgi:hypothetical protein